MRVFNTSDPTGMVSVCGGATSECASAEQLCALDGGLCIEWSVAP